jgi:hypothetical protein
MMISHCGLRRSKRRGKDRAGKSVKRSTLFALALDYVRETERERGMRSPHPLCYDFMVLIKNDLAADLTGS